MKFSDGLFLETARKVAERHPDIEFEDRIIDNLCNQLVSRPEEYDVIVLPNLYGDIVSDLGAGMIGGLGLAPSANGGEECAMFEAIHGSAPRRAGQDVANPSGLLLAGVMMLGHLGQGDVAERVHNAWLRTIEDGVHTADLRGTHTRRTVGTVAFADAVIERLGDGPRKLEPVEYSNPEPSQQREPVAYVRPEPARKVMVGVDVFVHDGTTTPAALGELLCSHSTQALQLQMITNRGVKVWPRGFPETFCTDHWRCRFVAPGTDTATSHRDIIELLAKLTGAGVDVIKTENLCTFDGVAGFALGQGQ
jgi:isocitrate dehydrogenase